MMASSSIRKVIGAVKDQTSISIAKVAGTVAPDLEVLVVKATSHDEEPADEKYITEILNLSSCSREYVSVFVAAISKRLNKTRDWIVALKALMLVHRVLIDGHFSFEEEIVYASRKGTRILNLSDFRDDANSNSWDHSCFVRFYAMYLDEKVESMVSVKKLKGGIDSKFDDDSRYDYGRSRRSKLYNNVNESVGETPLRDMPPEGVLEKLNQLLSILDRVLACRLTGRAKTSRLTIIALYQVVQESFSFYLQISEALGVLIDRFTEMDFGNRVKTFDCYVGAAKKIDELVGFYNWCKDLGIGRSSEFPEVQRIPNDVLKMLEGFLKEMETQPKALPPPRNYAPAPQFVPPTRLKHPQNMTEVLVNLEEDGISAYEQDNKLSFNGTTTNPDGSWVLFSPNSELEISSAWQTLAAETDNSDWELALVESASNLSNQKTKLGGGFDPSLLSGMYDQGSVTKHARTTQLSGGSLSSLAIGLGKIATPMLALPGPDTTIESEQQDPFAASLSVPPPSYVQIAEMEKKQQLLLEEQLIWQQYGREGMRGEVGLSKIGGGAFNYGFSTRQMIPNGMPQIGGAGSIEQPGLGGYYYYY